MNPWWWHESAEEIKIGQWCCYYCIIIKSSISGSCLSSPIPSPNRTKTTRNHNDNVLFYILTQPYPNPDTIYRTPHPSPNPESIPDPNPIPNPTPDIIYRNPNPNRIPDPRLGANSLMYDDPQDFIRENNLVVALP